MVVRLNFEDSAVPAVPYLYRPGIALYAVEYILVIFYEFSQFDP